MTQASSPLGSYRPLLLLVEDEPLLRELATEALESLVDLQVVAVSTADAALSYLEQTGARIDILFTDVRMPGRLDGEALAQLVSQRWPHIPVILTSGDRLTVSRGAGRTRFMPKPWHIDDMANCVNEALGQSRVA
ncbi:response regulator [Pseudomonas sp. PLB05]|uniref:response regulator n=1 Tax=Pseudomonas sp. PLB05 TaxID=2899078 RepID=UPI001E5A896C|nr:response regulator [Pseudomonas sp. PLB05]MCD4866095.1 response regulator [Pseudomonas sp. PLB05]